MENARTLMIATLGPASLKPEVLPRLFEAGVDVFRVNLSHGTRESHRTAILAAKATGAKVMIDLPGPKIRIADANVPFPVRLKAGETIFLSTNKAALPSGRPGLVLPQGLNLSLAHIGSHILVDDGNIELTARGFKDGFLETTTSADASILLKKGVAFTTPVEEFPPLVEGDKMALDELKDAPYDWVASSFVRNADCIIDLRAHLKNLGRDATLIAKIEDPAGVHNIESILQVTDGIMVARGDLGVCTPLAALPLLQKRLVALGIYHRKTVVVATQMLESMTCSRRPTRAEVTDVANAVLDGADAVMLSGETAVGEYPVETVETMAAIIENAESAMRSGLRTLL
jgi:pyruvate kinase